MSDALPLPAPANLSRFLGLLEEVNHILAELPAELPGPPLPECAMYLVSPEGLIRSWSDGAEHLYGFLQAEVLGRPLAVLEGEGGTGQRRRKDGQPFQVHLHEADLRDDHGRLLGTCRVELELPPARRSA
jgi:PAS domain-containing protein